MSITKRDKKLLIVLLGIAIFLASYLGIYNHFNARAEALRGEIAALEPRLIELRDHNSKLSMYQDGIELIGGTVAAELAKFPQDVRSEDMIMYATALEKSIGITVDSVSFLPPELIANISVPSSGPEGLVLSPYAAFHTGLSISCGLTYPQLKSLVTFIYSTPQRTSLDSISVGYNAETGSLSGAASLSKYFVCGADYVYTATDVPNISQGVSNPFGTVDVQKTPESTEPPANTD